MSERSSVTALVCIVVLFKTTFRNVKPLQVMHIFESMFAFDETNDIKSKKIVNTLKLKSVN